MALMSQLSCVFCSKYRNRVIIHAVGLAACYVRIRLDPDVPREDEKTSPAGSYRLPTPERVPEGTRSRTEEMQDGRSRTGDSECSEEPQRDTREKQVILVLRFVATSTGDIYTNERMRWSGIRERELSMISEVQ